MKKRILSLLLAIAVMLVMLPNGALAAEWMPVKGFSDVYQSVLDKPNGAKKLVCFTNICGDAVPEMILLASGADWEEVQVWTCQNSEAKKLLSADWTQDPASKHSLYKCGDGRLASYQTTTEFVVDYSRETRSGVYYTADSDGVYSESGSFSYDYYQLAFGASRFANGKLNGASAGESAVKAEEQKMLSGALIFDDQSSVSGVMSAQDAKKYLDNITASFFDVPRNSWYTDAVEHCYGNGVMSGVSPTRFAPQQAATRAMLVQTLYNWYGGAVPDGLGTTVPDYPGNQMYFIDVPQKAWYWDAVAWAFATHVVYGTSGTTFSPNRKVTREETVTMIYNCYKVSHPEAVTDPAGASTFSDYESVSPWAKTAMAWAVNYGLIFGQDGKLNPQGTTTRAQLAMILKNFATKRFTSVEPA